jgi:hypothetical protein
MRPVSRRIAVAAIGAAATIAMVIGAGIAADAYQPVQTTMYSTSGSTCNKSPCVLYPKSTQLPSGRLVAAFEDSEGPVVGQTLPIYKSDDNGTTWQKLTNLAPPSSLSSSSTYAPYTSNWTNPYFYVLPQAIGSLAAGTLMLADVVSGGADSSGNRQNVAIALYSSSDQGATWTVQSLIASGPNANLDPVWEPYLLVYNGQLVAYFSDENEADYFTGSAASNEGGQILAHKTSTNGTSWGSEVQDVGTAFYSGRPGMTNIVPTTDGKWILTFEYWGGGANTRYKVCATPVACDPNDGGTGFPGAQGGSPVLLKLPDGRIVYNAGGSKDVWVNASGSSTGSWLEYQTPIAAGYSRDLQYVSGTGRVVIIQAPWGTGPVSFAETDLGNSVSTSYSLVNRLTGQVLSTDANKTQDANLDGNVPDLISWANNASNKTQGWHTITKGSAITLLNQAGGRAVAIWTGNAVAGQRVAQWVDDGATDKQWTLIATSGGYYKLQSVRNTSLYLTGATANGAVTIDVANSTGSQEWQLVSR